MKMSESGLKFLIEREGKVSSMYNDTAGHCTVGVGHLVHKGNCDYPSVSKEKGFIAESPYLDGTPNSTVKNLNMEKPFFKSLTGSKVMELLKEDVQKFEKTVINNVKITLNQTQFDALVSFSFNIGPSAFKNSTLLKLLNQKKFKDVPSEMKRWIKETKDGKQVVNNGLINRREKESSLFESGKYN